jgi:tetratricopeptide (TPR) repeat protein
LIEPVFLSEAAMSEYEVWNEIGNIYYNKGAYEKANRAYKKVIEINPANPEPFRNLASIFIIQGRFAEAIPMFQRAIELLDKPIDKAYLWNQLGDIYQKLEDHVNANVSYRNAIELDQDDSSFQKNLAEVEQASQLFTLELPADNATPSPATGDQNPGDTFWVFQDEEPAPQIEGITPDITSATARGLLRLGILHWRKGECARAIQFLNTAIESAEKSQENFLGALAYNAIALIDTEVGKVEEAIQAYQKAANLAPERIFPWNDLGNLNGKLDRYDDARAAFQEAIEHNPKDPVSWNGLGDVYHKLGRNEDAIAAYQHGNVFEKQGAVEDALQEFEGIIAAEQEQPQVWQEEGDIYSDFGEYEDAIASYNKALKLDPSNATSQAGLARAEQALNNANGKSDLPSPATLIEYKPKNLPEPKFHVTERNPSPNEKEDDNDSVPEAAYWMFETSNTHTSAQLLTDSTHNRASLLVQLTPRADQPARKEDNIPVAVAVESRATATVDAGIGLPKSTPGQSRTTTSDLPPHINATASLATNQPSPDRKTLDNDISAYRRVLEINPQNDRAWDTLGNMYETVGLHDEAVSAFEQAIALVPQREVYHFHLGIALSYQMKYDKAIQALQRVVELNPNYMLAHCALAGCYRRFGKENEAQEHIKIARPSMENENEYNKACFESISGNVDRAFALLEIALKKQQMQPGMVRSDPDLDFIRHDPRFEVLLYRTKNIS